MLHVMNSLPIIPTIAIRTKKTDEKAVVLASANLSPISRFWIFLRELSNLKGV